MTASLKKTQKTFYKIYSAPPILNSFTSFYKAKKKINPPQKKKNKKKNNTTFAHYKITIVPKYPAEPLYKAHL